MAGGHGPHLALVKLVEAVNFEVHGVYQDFTFTIIVLATSGRP